LRSVLEHQGVCDHLLTRLDSRNLLHVAGKHLPAGHFDAPEFTRGRRYIYPIPVLQMEDCGGRNSSMLMRRAWRVGLAGKISA
jgi:hypothetical protein